MAHRQDDALFTIAIFETELEAWFARGVLQASGIRALVPGDGSFTLQVFESDRDRALVELRRLRIRIVPLQHRA